MQEAVQLLITNTDEPEPKGNIAHLAFFLLAPNTTSFDYTLPHLHVLPESTTQRSKW